MKLLRSPQVGTGFIDPPVSLSSAVPEPATGIERRLRVAPNLKSRRAISIAASFQTEVRLPCNAPLHVSCPAAAVSLQCGPMQRQQKITLAEMRSMRVGPADLLRRLPMRSFGRSQRHAPSRTYKKMKA
jgi:hypothetical protein